MRFRSVCLFAGLLVIGAAGLRAPAAPDIGLFASVNAASFSDQPVAPGSLVSGFGAGLAEHTVTAKSLPLPRELDAVQVLVNGEPAPLQMVSPGQINYVLPQKTPLGTATVEVTRKGEVVARGVVLVWQVSPGLFTRGGGGGGQGAVANADWSLNSEEKPARPGEFIHIFGTGAGAVTPPVPDGAAAPSEPLSRTVSVPEVLIDGQRAEVSFSGLAPGMAATWLIDARIPPGVTPGPGVSLRVRLAGRHSNRVTIAVR
ncbi:MAG TPA: hypothetical protein VNN18_12590 [Candidatus Xenobia bacterium]|nr:hypothetical protein [Candidatus Xenobia bacterium]